MGGLWGAARTSRKHRRPCKGVGAPSGFRQGRAQLGFSSRSGHVGDGHFEEQGKESRTTLASQEGSFHLTRQEAQGEGGLQAQDDQGSGCASLRFFSTHILGGLPSWSPKGRLVMQGQARAQNPQGCLWWPLPGLKQARLAHPAPMPARRQGGDL